MSVVLDSLATLAWIHSEETPEAIRQVFDIVAENGATLPALWWLVVATRLTVAVRRRRVDAQFRRAALADLALLDITTDPHTGNRTWGETLILGDRFGLNAYDAPYLELAQRHALPLGTLDAHGL